jgi:hypothetical protein
LRAAPAGVAVSLLLAWTGSAIAEEGSAQRTLTRDRAPATVSSSYAERSIQGERSAFSIQQHDGTDQHLPPTQQNIDLVSRLEMNTPQELRTTEFPEAVIPGQIADVAVYKNFAYLMSWNEPSCQRGGTFVVDINDPANPQQVGFIPAMIEEDGSRARYHGEGAHVITLDTPSFQGDVLAVNNEPYFNSDCAPPDPAGFGGFDLYDVSDPRNPQVLVQGAGDFEDGGQTFETANSSHSIFIWQGDDRRAFAVIVDNVEGTDVDIFDISDPTNPQFIAEYDLDEYLQTTEGVDIIDEGGIGGEADVFLHDMVVKKMGDRQVMLADYWDAGYVTLDVTNPEDISYIGDSHYDDPDPLTGREPQEGNGHQGEFSHDNRFILAADEDFSPYRPGTFEISGGQFAGTYPSNPIGGGASPAFLPDDVMNGPTAYVGYACPDPDGPGPATGSDPVPPQDSVGMRPLQPGEEAIAVIQRGPSGDPDNPEDACFPGEKAQQAIDAGYDAVLFANHHPGENLDPDNPFCGSGAFPDSPPIVSVCTTHDAMHKIFGSDPPTTEPYPPGHGPPLGTLGETVRADALFDGWGYARLIENTDGKMREIDAHAVQESLNPQYAFGFGDLSIHEFATDPTENVAYSSYYAAGMRVFTFGEGGLIEAGKFIDEGGNNFWGVEQFTNQNERYFVGSDRDFGLYVFKYTGPDAAQRPACTDTTVIVPWRSTAEVPLPCSDANGNPLDRSIVSGPSDGTLSGDADSGTVSYQHTGGSVGSSDSLTFMANDGAADSNTATVNIVIVAREDGACFNPFTGDSSDDRIVGSQFGDDLRGAGGKDLIQALEGDDCLFGGGQRDQLEGDIGDDRLTGGGAKDRMFGGAGDDVLAGKKGRDHQQGGSGDDKVGGGSRADFLDGGSNNDRVTGGRGDDKLRGGPGRDRVSGKGGDDHIEGGDGRNRLSGGGGADKLYAVNDRVDRIRCGSGDDEVLAEDVDVVAGDCESVSRVS